MRVINVHRPRILNLLGKFLNRELSIKELNRELFIIESGLVGLNSFDESLCFQFFENDKLYESLYFDDLLNDFRTRIEIEDKIEIAIENPSGFNVILK